MMQWKPLALMAVLGLSGAVSPVAAQVYRYDRAGGVYVPGTLTPVPATSAVVPAYGAYGPGIDSHAGVMQVRALAPVADPGLVAVPVAVGRGTARTITRVHPNHQTQIIRTNGVGAPRKVRIDVDTGPNRTRIRQRVR